MRDTEAIAQIKARPLADSSDSGLAHALREAGAQAGDDTPATTFAIVDEAIRRRLGTWRLFGTGFEHEAVLPYRRMAQQVAEAGLDLDDTVTVRRRPPHSEHPRLGHGSAARR